MVEQLSLPPQKQGEKTRLAENSSPKTYQMLLEIRGSNQTRRIKCRSRENAQSSVHVGQTVPNTPLELCLPISRRQSE